MIEFQEFTLENGLRVILHEDKTAPQAVFNLLYDVGSRDENEHKTGFAHLFEHLMFGGSAHVPSYDEPVQMVGGENNAFTNTDITNYYISLPAQNLETAFWLESDRMLSLSFDPNVLEVQRKVVIEEFKQRYLNQPYGDAMLLLRDLAYTKHPYRWATIGKEIAHIEQATMEDVKEFFFTHYRPENAILVVAGFFDVAKVKGLTEKWFGTIPKGNRPDRKLPTEPLQTEARRRTVSGKVPMKAIYKAFHMPGRNEALYYEADLISDILGRGKSARLHEKLVQEKELFNSINAYVTATFDPGLLIIEGKIKPGITFEEAEAALDVEIQKLATQTIEARELQKVKNQAESTLVFAEIELLNRAINLAYFKLMGDANRINQEGSYIQAVSVESLQKAAAQLLKPENCSTLLYQPE